MVFKYRLIHVWHSKCDKSFLGGSNTSESSVQKYNVRLHLRAVFKVQRSRSAKIIQHISRTQSKVCTCMASWHSQNKSVATIYLCCCIANCHGQCSLNFVLLNTALRCNMTFVLLNTALRCNMTFVLMNTTCLNSQKLLTILSCLECHNMYVGTTGEHIPHALHGASYGMYMCHLCACA